MIIDFNSAAPDFLLARSSGADPMQSLAAGAALAKAVSGGRVGVGFSADAGSRANAGAVVAGLSSCCARVWNFGEVFEAQLSFLLPFASMRAGVFIDAQRGVLRVLGGDGLAAPAAVRERVSRGLRRIPQGEYAEVFDMSALRAAYARELFGRAKGITAGCTVESANPAVRELLRSCLAHSQSGPVLRVNRAGLGLSAFTRTTGVVECTKIIALCAMHELESGRDVAVPFDAPRFLDGLALRCGARLYRYPSPADESEPDAAGQLARRLLWPRDALFLAVQLMTVLSRRGTDFESLCASLPDFHIFRKVIKLGLRDDFAQSLNEAGLSAQNDGTGGLVVGGQRGYARLSPLSTQRLVLTAQGASAEAALELCADIQALLEKKGNV